jgi:S1-C subfamily serine protease
MQAGIRKDDVIVNVGDVPTGSLQQYRSAIQSVTVGTTETIVAVRKGKKITKKFTARELPASTAEEFAWHMLGIAVVQNSEKAAKSYSLKTTQGMVISKVRVQSPAGRAGIQPGDVLLAIGGATINDMDQFRQVCASLRLAESAIVVVQRDVRAYYLSLRLD